MQSIPDENTGMDHYYTNIKKRTLTQKNANNVGNKTAQSELADDVKFSFINQSVNNLPE